MNSIFGEYQAKNLPFNESIIARAIVLEDLNGDGRIDIVFGNERDNEVYLRKDDGSFDIVQLPGDQKITSSIAVGDLNGDDIVDIVIGNLYEPDQILMSTEKNLDGKIYNYNIMELSTSSNTYDVALGDMDNNGLLDIVVVDKLGNSKSKIYLNYNATFDEIILPLENHVDLVVSIDVNTGEPYVLNNIGEYLCIFIIVGTLWAWCKATTTNIRGVTTPHRAH